VSKHGIAIGQALPGAGAAGEPARPSPSPVSAACGAYEATYAVKAVPQFSIAGPEGRHIALYAALAPALPAHVNRRSPA
jgi:hypothetical protein